MAGLKTHPGRLAQTGQEWLEYKAQHPISGTAVGVIENVNPYMKSDAWLRDAVRALSGQFKDLSFIKAVKHGNFMEPWAREWYEREYEVEVHEAGVGVHQRYDWLTQSPDGLIPLDGGIEIKCPMPGARIYSVWDEDKKHYLRQVQLMMEVWDLDWVDFLCFQCSTPGAEPVAHKLVRVEREDKWLTQPLAGSLLPHPRKGTVQRIDLYWEWHKHVHAEFDNFERRAKHLDEDAGKEIYEVVKHDALSELTAALTQKREIETKIAADLTTLKTLDGVIKVAKNAVADAYQRSVTDGSTKVQVTHKTPPVDYEKAFDALGGIIALESKGYEIDSYRRKTNTRQVTVKQEES